VRLYASSGCRYDWRDNPRQLIEEALGYIDQGYTALKFRIGTEWAWDGVTVDRFLGLVRELAQEVDGRMDLMLDGNQRLTEERGAGSPKSWIALSLSGSRSRFPRTTSTPTPGSTLRWICPSPAASSTQRWNASDPIWRSEAYGVVQPDAGICGITELLRIAEMADRYGVDLCPHSWHNGLMCMAHAHVVAGLPNAASTHAGGPRPEQGRALSDPGTVAMGDVGRTTGH
jgi:L-alanine-DL-glutamate epimerase-like enolase superfamily enzyme